jgi:hypothetical protein
MIFNISFFISVVFMLSMILPEPLMKGLMVVSFVGCMLLLDSEERNKVYLYVKPTYDALKYDISLIDLCIIYPFTFMCMEFQGRNRYSLPYGCFPVYDDYCELTIRGWGWLVQLLVITIILVVDVLTKLFPLSCKIDVILINIYYLSMMLSCVNMILQVQSFDEYTKWGKRTQPLVWESCILWYIVLKSYMCVNHYFPPSLTVTQHVKNDDAECLESEGITISNPAPLIWFENTS